VNGYTNFIHLLAVSLSFRRLLASISSNAAKYVGLKGILSVLD